MKKLIALALLAMMILSTNVSANEWDKIRIGVEGAYPPFSWVEKDGTLKGFDIDIAMALCEEIGAECVLVPQDWDGIIPALLARKYDAIIASMSITEERKKKVAFSDKYYNTPAKFARKFSWSVVVFIRESDFLFTLFCDRHRRDDRIIFAGQQSWDNAVPVLWDQNTFSTNFLT